MVANGEQKVDLWLVKSGEKILGPFTTGEVAQRLRSREIVLIDEAAQPHNHWRYLRDQPAFSEVVEEIRKNLLNSHEDTEVQGHTKTPVQSGEATETVDFVTEGSLASFESGTITRTPRPTSLRSNLGYEVSDIRDADYTEEPVEPPSKEKTRSRGEAEVRKYGTGDDDDVQRSISRHSRLIWLFTFLIMVGIGSILVNLKAPQPPPLQPAGGPDLHEPFKRSFADAETAWNRGDWEEALTLYRRADQLIPGVPDVIVRLAPLMMKLEGQTVEAKRALQDLTEHTADSGAQMDAKLGLGLAAMIGDDVADAEKIYKQILALNPNQVVAKFNLGMLKFIHGDYKQAVPLFIDATRINSELSAAHLMLALSYAAQGGDQLKSASDVLEAFLPKHADFHQEGQVLMAWLMLEGSNRLQAVAATQMALDSDPFITGEHFHDPLLFLDPLSGGTISTYCQKIHDKLQDNTSLALSAVCLSKSNRRDEAEHAIAGGLVLAPEEPHLLAVNAYLLMLGKQFNEAKVTLTQASKDGGSRLATILTGRNCALLQDAACAKKTWTSLVDKEPPSLAALVGLATIESQDGHLEQAKQWLIKAETLSPRYIPAIRLREKVPAT